MEVSALGVKTSASPMRRSSRDSTAIHFTCGCAKRCDQQLTLSINNPNGVEDSIQIEEASTRWVLVRKLPTRAGTEFSAICMAIHNDVVCDLLPMTRSAVRALPYR